MSLNSVILAVEDRLSDAISTKILESFDIGIMLRIGFKGNSYLQQKAPSLNQTARGPYNVFILTDLDSPQSCPPQLIQSWISAPLNSGFFLRVAVMEVESWIMADRSALAKFLSIPVRRIPSNTDDIPNPKEFLVSLARRSNRRRLRDQLVPALGATTARVGPEYNSRFSEFIQIHWDLERAAVAFPSLKRTLDRIRSAKTVSDASQD
ncbi:hypothetical protein C6502_08800 [Candidatus Poribacteria bacterium]|nr:MAG: hypothetical protein C6502_08800 [Candidatus Poribacteria bacterium]